MTHPALETLAEFIDGKLRGETRDVVVVHIEECDDCLMIVGETSRLFDEVPAPIKRSSHRAWPMMVAAMVAIAFFSSWILRDRLLDPLNALERESRNLETRPVAGRLEGFDYRPARPIRGEQEPTDPKVQVVRSFATKIQKKYASSTQDAKRQHAAGVAALIAGDRAAAQKMLRRAADLSPETSAYWSDYAVALAESGQFDDALHAALNAVGKNPPSDSARFNLALIYELLGQREKAAAAYDEFLKRDQGSPWAGEAMENRRRLPGLAR